MDRPDDLSSKAFKRADTNINGKLKKYFLTHYPHYLVPGYNLNKTPWIDSWSAENVMGLHQEDQEFPYNCDLPKPLLPPAKITKDVLKKDGDPALQLLATKAHIDNAVKKILDRYPKDKKAFSAIPLKKDLKWEAGVGGDEITLPRHVADIVEAIEMDPDPHFAGRYNWYYTGGSLATVPLGEEKIFIFPYVGDLVATPVWSMKSSLWKPNLRTAASCELDEIIYETRTRMHKDNCRILGRSKYSCIFYSLAEDSGKLRMVQIHKQQSRIPYVSGDLDPIYSNKFCTMDVKRTLILSDILSCRSIRSNTVDAPKPLVDKWGSVRFMKSDPSIIVFVDRCCVHYLDTRVRDEHPVLTLCPRGNLEACESLCLAIPSSTEDHNYVASYHSLLLCDRRSPQACVQQKWTHQFKSAPLLATVHARNEKEMIVLSSQISGETAIILNTWGSRDNPHSYNLPYRPPSIRDTLKECHMRGKCLDPSLRKRFELCNAGISSITDKNGDLWLFLQNSIDDIFYQCITHEEALDDNSPVNCQAYNVMEAWEKRILFQERVIKPLVITDRVNMRHVFESFTKKTSRPRPDIQQNESCGDPEWKQSLEKLQEYTDILAPKLLAAWKITEDSVPANCTAVPNKKVVNWLEKNAGNVQSQEDKDFSSTPIDTQELFSVPQQPECIDIVDDVPQESYYPPVRVKAETKSQTKKRTYVPGF